MIVDVDDAKVSDVIQSLALATGVMVSIMGMRTIALQKRRNWKLNRKQSQMSN
jgi:hypothetical protein